MADSTKRFLVRQGPWRWECIVFGEGQRTLFAFHGFDNDADDLTIFQPSLSPLYRMVSVNLFFHGNSHSELSPDEAHFDTTALKDLFEQLLEQLSVERFSLLGFSLGGRICLELIGLFADRIDQCYLLAADGLRISPWYRFLTRNPLGHRLFQNATDNPSTFLKLAGFFRKTGLVGEKQYKFAWSYFNTQEKRKKVYDVWTIFRLLLPDRKSICQQIIANELTVDLIFGKRDSVIPAVHAKKWKRSLKDRCRIHVTDDGHNLLKQEIGALIARIAP
ncbi:MAG: hypothetical protein RL021_1062 [Bacteroidota bacterium]